MSGGGKKQKQTTTSNSTQTSSAPDYAAPYLADIAHQASNVYDAGRGYTGGFAPQTQQAIDLATGIAQSGNPLGRAVYDRSLDTLANGGLTGGQRSVIGALGNEYGALSGPTSAQTNLSRYADGSMLSGNPYLDQMLATTNEGIANRVNGAFGGAGRSFSPAHAAAVAKNIAASDNAARFADWNQQVQNQFNANQMIDSSANARAGLRSNILGQAFGAEQTGVGNVNNVAANMGAIDQGRYLDADALNRIGQQVQAQEATQASVPWQQLQNYVSTVRNAAGNYGTQTGNSTSTTERPGPSGLQQAIGAATAIAGLATGNPMMAVQGASSFGGGGGGKGGKGGAGAGGLGGMSNGA